MEPGAFESILEGARLVFSLDRETFGIAGRSLLISGSASLMAFSIGVAFASITAFSRLPFKGAVKTLMNALLSIPAVAIGLFIYLLLGRGGFVETHGILFTPTACVIAQSILGCPIAASLSMTLFEREGEGIREEILSLGAGPLQFLARLYRELLVPMAAILVLVFSRVIGETGMTMMVGGNIKGFTRVLTTTIALETMKGEFELAVALTILLLSIALCLNISIQLSLRRMGR